MTKPITFFRLCCGLLLSVSVGCAHHPVSSTSTIVVTAANSTIAAGLTTQLHAIEHESASQTTDVTSLVTWKSSNAAVATVNAHGLLTGVAAGSAGITATLGTIAGSLNETIGKATVTKLAVTPASTQIFTSGSQQFTATATYTDGSTQNLSSTVTWSITPATAATINSAGLMRGVAAGPFTVTATSGAIVGTANGTITTPTLASIAISPPSTSIAAGSTRQFVATGAYTDQSTQDLTGSVTWVSSNPSVLAINTNGLATAASVTTATAVTLTAQTGSFSATAAVNVTPQATATSLVVEPTSSSLAQGTAQQNTAIAYYSDGTQQNVTSQVTWSVAAATPSSMKGPVAHRAHKAALPRDASSGAVTVNQNGVAFANQAGAGNLQATFGSVQSQSVLLVHNVTIQYITISASVLGLPQGSTQQLSLRGWFSDGSTQDLSLTANWQSSNTSVATINAQGLMTGVNAGNVQFSAGFGGLTATTPNIQILPTDLVSLTIKVPSPAFEVGAVGQFNVIGTYANGRAFDVTSLATFKSSNPSIFQISNSGFLQTVGAGRAQITATVNSFSAVTNLEAVAATLVSLVVLPTDDDFALGTSLQFTALAYFSDGAQADLTQSVVWTSADPTVLTINQNGLAKSGSIGSTTVTASTQGVSQTSPLAHVTSATLTHLAVTPGSARIAASTHAQFTATGWFTDGSVEDLSHDALWSVSAPAIASVDTNGNVLGVAPGTATVAAFAEALTSNAPVTVTNATLESTVISPGNFELPAGISRPLALIGNFSDGATQDMTADAIWISPTPSIAFATATGTAVGLTPGVGTVSAQLGNFTSATQVNVTDASLTAISLTPATTVIRQRGGQQMTAMGTFSDGFQQNLYLNAVLLPADPTVAYIRATGLALGEKIGSTQITASFRNLKATTTSFQVLSGDLVSVALTPTSPAVTAGGTVQLTATGTYADGTTSDVSKLVAWTSSNPAVLSIDSNGLGTAHATSVPVTVTATEQLGTSTQFFTVTVSPAPIGAIQFLTVEPSATTIAEGATRQYSAFATYGSGSKAEVTGTAAWTSSNPSVATIDNSGLATTVGVGSTLITATANGVSASVLLNGDVPLPAGDTLVSIGLSPGTATLAAGATQQFIVIGTYADGATEDISSAATWQTSAPAVASLTSAGIAYGASAGTTTITAQLGGVSGSASLTVTAGSSGAAVTSISISPVSATIGILDTQVYNAVATYSDGSTQNVNSTATWSSSSPTVATLAGNGVATGLATGTTAIGATLNGVSGNAALTVSNRHTPGGNPLTFITVAPASTSIVVGGTQQYTATGIYSDGTTHSITGSVTWSSATPATASVTSAGLATGLAAGSASVIAQSGNLVSTGVLTVTPSSATLTSLFVTPTSTQIIVGLTKQFAAIGNYSDGTIRNLASSATWSSSSAGVATVSSSGQVTAVSAGIAIISCTSGSLTSQSTVIVNSGTLQSLAISPNGESVPAGAQQQLTVTGTYSNGSRADLTSVATWSSLTPSVASVSTGGLVTGVAPGTVQMSAAYQSQTGMTTVTITPPALSSVAITPSWAKFAKGTTQQFNVIGTYTDGTNQNVTGEATFLGSNAGVLTVSSSGVALGTAAGTGTITVNVGGITATTQTLTVTAATLVSIAITPNTPTFANGTTQKFTAIGTFSDGSTQDITNQAVWSSSTPQTATIDVNGLATSGVPGSTVISATLDGVTGSSGTAKVSSAVLSSLALTPATSQIAKGANQQFTATGTFSDASTQNLSTEATWSTSSASVASIDGNGLATANSPGTSQIAATFGNFTASTSSFTVTSATLASIAFSPASPTIAQGTSAQVTVTGTFSDGTTQNLTNSSVYSSGNPAAVTVSNSGLLTAFFPGASVVSVLVNGVTNTFTATATNATLSSIAITPATPLSVAKGSTEPLTATGTFSDGSTENLSSAVTWTSSVPAILTVDGNGLVTGLGAGSATVTAALQGKSATTPAVQVTAAVVASISVTPAAASVVNGATQQYAATATYTDGTTQNVTSSATWSSSSPGIATIPSTGLATAVAPGTTTITALYNSVSGSTTLTVTSLVAPTLTTVTVTPSSASVAKGNTQQFTATGTYSDGSMQSLTSVATWQSSATSIATVNNQGLATSVNGGNAQISATSNGVSGVSALTVSAATLVSISVTPATASVANGTSQQYRAVGTLSDGSTQDLTNSVTWSSSNTNAATVNSVGLAATLATGSATITAQAGATSGAAVLTVSAATVVSVQVIPSSVTLPVAGMQQLAVTATFSDGSSQNVTSSAGYLSANTGVATVSALGVVTATGAGSTLLTVSQGSASTTVPVTVTAATLTAITVSPASFTLPVGGSQQLTATGSYSDGSTENLTSSVVWASSASTVATVSTAGNVQVNRVGSATITANDGSVTGSSALTATSAVVTAIAVTPASATLAVGQSQQFTATATLSDGTQQNVTTAATWSSSDATKATISNSSGSNGMMAAVGAGNAMVSATLNTIAGSASVTVTSAALSSLTVSPSPVSLPAGTTQPLTVTGHYSDGSTSNVTSAVTWTSSSAAIASVDVSGLLHGVSAGSATVTATDGSVSKADAITVTSATLNSISITPANSTVPLGLTSQLTATGTYSDGSTANLTSQVQWSSSSAAVATVSSSGLVSTVTAGSTQITAALGSVSGQTPLTVSAAVLESIAVEASQSSFALGLTLQLTAIGTYSDNTTQNITSLVSWSSQTPSIGIVNSSGLASGVNTGSFNARAALRSVTGSLSLTVTNAVLQSIVVTPANPTIVGVSGSPTQFTATGHFSDGSTQNITNSCHWAITGGVAVGSISQTGSFSALGLGNGTVTATSGTISGSTGFTIVSI